MNRWSNGTGPVPYQYVRGILKIVISWGGRVGAHPIRTVHTAVSNRFCARTIQFIYISVHMDIWYHQTPLVIFNIDEVCCVVDGG